MMNEYEIESGEDYYERYKNNIKNNKWKSTQWIHGIINNKMFNCCVAARYKEEYQQDFYEKCMKEVKERGILLRNDTQVIYLTFYKKGNRNQVLSMLNQGYDFTIDEKIIYGHKIND